MTRFATMAAAAFVAACATAPRVPIPLDGLPAAFEMGGRLSVAQSGQGEILRIRWSHALSDDTWVLATPVGTEVARIERDHAAEGLTVLRPGAEPMSAASFAELTQSLLGAALDERLLVAWLHGRPLAGPEGWAVTIDESQRIGEADVARRITATRGDTVVKLVVDQYRAQPE
ncbi:MAG TPA: outer membrane lipoprotein LolB [Usitatibacteraceae bacterium]|nr:outer membrane lipoprotein LolB [Usitatibacteraceae bacterium]